MPGMKFHVVENDNGQLIVLFGTKRPPNTSGSAEELQQSLQERWIPEGWTVLESFDDEPAADKALVARAAKREAANEQNRTSQGTEPQIKGPQGK